MPKQRAPLAPVPTSKDELLIAALRHANEVSGLLNDLGTEVSRLDEMPVKKRRTARLHNLLRRRFLENSAVHLFIAASNLRLELPADLKGALDEDEGAAQALHHERTGEDPSMWLAVHMPLKHVWLGVSVEDQDRADERIPLLLQTPAAVRFLSCEPLLGPLNLDEATRDGHPTAEQVAGPHGMHYLRHGATRIDWVIAGGESGPNARPMHPDWARSLRDQCVTAGVPFFFKQWGAHFPAELALREGDETPWRIWPDGQHRWIIGEYGRDLSSLPKIHFSRVGKKEAGRLLDGREHSEFPR